MAASERGTAGGEASCCSPSVAPGSAPVGPGPAEVPLAPRPPRDRSVRGQVRLPAGRFEMGDHFGEGYPADGEGPVHEVALRPFWMDETSVTNAQFGTFVRETGHVTDAERFGSSAVFHLDVAAAPQDVLGAPVATPWWREVRGADWRHPEGPRSDIARRQNHPVVQVSWRDAAAYAAWAGKRLPTEAEWEYAARDGRPAARFPWGDELTPRGRWLCNIWQGRFPVQNTADDGYRTTAPAKSFYVGQRGLWSMVGNVWEWCADWFSPTTYADRVRAGGGVVADPVGPADGQARVIRGGSFLCHDSYCSRYRVAARSANTPESSTANTGFRCANDDA
ncbi:formylglycine-generating enzyme family protein [Nocardioides sp. L-11A]|uniref:formylglycine-generating enzyme family protein n=1 Tax=Nocardioides sp. L-11A TaxID=3043848 RepID=UPI00249B3A60|nr:formylglycine-generating enzyme family protein [Nocardioides sp. L-11A]